MAVMGLAQCVSGITVSDLQMKSSNHINSSPDLE